MASFLSPAWIGELAGAAARDPAVAEAARGLRLRCTQVVIGPGGERTIWQLRVDDGRVEVVPGEPDPGDVCFEQDLDTARDIAAGRINAQEAFLAGRLRVTGRVEALRDAMALFAALDTAFAPVRATTDLG